VAHNRFVPFTGFGVKHFFVSPGRHLDHDIALNSGRVRHVKCGLGLGFKLRARDFAGLAWFTGLAQNPGPRCLGLLVNVVKALARRSGLGLGPTRPYFKSLLRTRKHSDCFR
jgi:hypothetical protein